MEGKRFANYLLIIQLLSVNLTISQQQLQLLIKYSKYVCKVTFGTVLSFQGIAVFENSYC